MSRLTHRAIELTRIGYSPSEATAMAVMQLGMTVTPEACARVETLCAADVARFLAGRSANRRAV